MSTKTLAKTTTTSSSPSLGIWTPEGTRKPPRLHVPNTDQVRIGDGRTLRLVHTEPPRAYNPEGFRVYRHSKDGMLVTVCLEDHFDEGILLHVSLSFPKHQPTLRDAAAVRRGFFPPAVEVLMPLPPEDTAGDERMLHMWEAPAAWAPLR